MHDVRCSLSSAETMEEGRGLTEGNLEVAEKARETAHHQ
jgi:hypothetical protein